MSNVIKAYSVRFNDESRIMIDTHLRMDKELEEKRRINSITAVNPPEGFVEGLKAVVVDTLPTAEEIQEQNSRILDDAGKEANQILEQAKKEAEQIKKDAYSSGHKKGYEDGSIQSKKEASRLKAEYEEKERKLQTEYESLVQSLEPEMAKLIGAFVEKITGILVEDKEEVIGYLVSKAIRNMDKCDEYTIRVSKEDYEFLSSKKEILLEAIGREAALFIAEDITLKKNQCLIETELKVINCSLDVQLGNLATDLRLISGI